MYLIPQSIMTFRQGLLFTTPTSFTYGIRNAESYTNNTDYVYPVFYVVVLQRPGTLFFERCYK